MTALDTFRTRLQQPHLVSTLRSGLIGKTAQVEGPYGPKRLVYADYVASGRGLAIVEDFIRDEVLPYYANSHTEASYCGAFMTRLREAARVEIGELVGASESQSVIFCGSGATSGINQLVGLLGVPEIVSSGGKVVVLVGPYEHHSNLLPWRESGAEVIEIAEAENGGPDLVHLTQELIKAQSANLIIGAFSAVSNVTGICTDTDAVTRCLKSHGAVALWDYAGGGPYVEMNMRAGSDCAKDAIVFSAHKFPGGPGASGVLIVNNEIVQRDTPTLPGGGTVKFVSPWGHAYSGKLSARQEAGTPNVLGDIRAALVLMIKDALGQEWLDARHAALRSRALDAWSDLADLDLLGNLDAKALPIFSFRVQSCEGERINHQLFTRLLSDLYGIQARGGCACAGSYAHRLLNIDSETSAKIMTLIDAGHESEKPGWVRLNLSVLNDDNETDFIIESVKQLVQSASAYVNDYVMDPATARFFPREPGAAFMKASA